MKFSTAALATALTVAAASNAATVRDTPHSVTYYIAEADHTCTFTQGSQGSTCSPGRVGDAKDIPDNLKGAFKIEEHPKGNTDGPNDLAWWNCRFTCDIGFIYVHCRWHC